MREVKLVLDPPNREKYKGYSTQQEAKRTLKREGKVMDLKTTQNTT